jgi:hypothetical protein
MGVGFSWLPHWYLLHDLTSHKLPPIRLGDLDRKSSAPSAKRTFPVQWG